MYCEHCGAILKEGAAFCTNCGAPVAQKPVDTPAEPVYQQPAAPVYTPMAAPSTRKPLIAPAILAIAAAALMFILWCVNLRTIPYWVDSLRYDADPYLGYLIFRFTVGALLPIAAGIFLFLFCLVQYRKGKASLLGIGLLMLVVFYGIGLLSYLLRFGLKMTNANGRTLLYMFLETAIFVLLLIGMIGAFKKRLNKIVLIIAAGLIFIEEFIILVTGSWQATSVFDFLANALLAVAILLIALLWKKPAEEN